MNVETFADKGPELRPEQFFDGRFEGWGVLMNPLGGLQSRFTVEASGARGGEAAVDFTETWTLDNGHVDTLHWTITALGEGRYVGAEPRLEGQAHGDQAGCALHWRYTRDTPQPGGGSTKLHFDDWFWRVGETGLIARGSAAKLGVPFATAHVTYRKLG